MISNMTIFSEISRIEGAESKAEVDEIVWLLTHGSNLVPIKSEDVMYLYDVSFIEKRRFTSLMGGYARMDSIVQEIKLVEVHLYNLVLGVIALKFHRYHPFNGLLQRALKDVVAFG